MRFAITACDSSLGVFHEFIKAGWEPVKLFSFPTPDSLDSTNQVIEFAQSQHISIQMSPITEDDLRALGEAGCEALIIANYKWRIGNWHPYLKYAVNFHPSPLPEARGPYPISRAILEERKSWAVTCHRIAPDFDTGDILAAETFQLGASECHESLSLKVQMASIRLSRRIANNFIELWEQTTPQGEGSYWPKLTQEELSFNFSHSVNTLMRQVRALGLLQCLAQVNGIWIAVRRAVGWTELHSHAPGSVVYINNNTIVVAASDGYIAIIEWSLAATDGAQFFRC